MDGVRCLSRQKEKNVNGAVHFVLGRYDANILDRCQQCVSLSSSVTIWEIFALWATF